MTGYSLVLSILDTIPDCCILRAGTLRLPGGVGRYWARWSWAPCDEAISNSLDEASDLTKIEEAEEAV